MRILKNDNSAVQYERTLKVVPIQHNHFLKYCQRLRLKKVYIQGRVLTEDNEMVDVEVPECIIKHYTLCVKEIDIAEKIREHMGKVYSEVEFLCGFKAIDAIECCKILACGNLTSMQMEDILKSKGYPKINNVQKYYKAALNHYCRYNNIISRTNFMLDFVELTEVRDL